MITNYQVGLIKGISQYVSTCSGVYHRKNQFKPWGAIFQIKGFQNNLGYFETETEAIQVYNDYHERYYQNILIQLKKEREELYGPSDTSKI
jgi:hypothetical protein